jgi:hypothetical protein
MIMNVKTLALTAALLALPLAPAFAAATGGGGGGSGPSGGDGGAGSRSSIMDTGSCRHWNYAREIAAVNQQKKTCAVRTSSIANPLVQR